MARTIRDIMHTAPVIPVITIEHLDHALPLAQALVEGGLRVLEITLRTPVALDAIRMIRDAFPDAITGAGTVLDVATFDRAVAAGAEFIVSPGATPALLDHITRTGVPTLPGVNTPSEVMRLLDHGLNAMKFFPAEAAGGIPLLKAFSAPLPQALFCPTGGITPTLAPQYLALPNVACVGGSWMVTGSLVASADWERIRQLAAEAAGLTHKGVST